MKDRMLMWIRLWSQQFLINTIHNIMKHIYDGSIPTKDHPIRQIAVCFLVMLLYGNDQWFNITDSRVTPKMRAFIDCQVECALHIMRDNCAKKDCADRCEHCVHKKASSRKGGGKK